MLRLSSFTHAANIGRRPRAAYLHLWNRPGESRRGGSSNRAGRLVTFWLFLAFYNAKLIIFTSENSAQCKLRCNAVIYISRAMFILSQPVSLFWGCKRRQTLYTGEFIHPIKSNVLLNKYCPINLIQGDVIFLLVSHFLIAVFLPVVPNAGHQNFKGMKIKKYDWNFQGFTPTFFSMFLHIHPTLSICGARHGQAEWRYER